MLKDLLGVALEPVSIVYPQQAQDSKDWQTTHLQVSAEGGMVFKSQGVYSVSLFQITVMQKSWVVGPKYKIMDKALFLVLTKKKKAANYLQNL